MATADDETFKRMVACFWEEKGDPTRYVGWDPKRCEQLMPMFFEAWSKQKMYAAMANLLARHEGGGPT